MSTRIVLPSYEQIHHHHASYIFFVADSVPDLSINSCYREISVCMPTQSTPERGLLRVNIGVSTWGVGHNYDQRVLGS